MNCRFTNHSL